MRLLIGHRLTRRGILLSGHRVGLGQGSEPEPAPGVYLQRDYGATGDGVTNDSAAFLAFQADYVDDPDPVTINIEAGTYVQGAHWMQGIDNLTVQGGPATFADNRRVGTNDWQRQTAMHSLRLDAVTAGATVLTVKNTDPARLPVALGNPSGNPSRDLTTLMALVSPGDWVLLSAWDTMGFGYPTNPQVFEYAQVASVGASAITLTAPTKHAYSDAWPVYWNGATLQAATNISGLSGTFQAGETVTASGGATGLVVHSYPSSFNGATDGVRFTLDSLVGKTVAAGETLTGATSGATATVVATGPNGLGGYRNFEADQAGPATLHVFDQSWNTEVTLRDLTWATLSDAQVSMAGRSLTFERVDFTGMTATPNSIWPSGAKDLTFIDCDMNSPEHDKLVETLTIQGGSAGTHIAQSASIDRMVINGHTCNSITGTARNTEITGTTVAGALKIGPSGYGATESVAISTSSAGTLDWQSGRDEMLAGVTFNAGVFTKSDPNDQGVATFGQGWAFPGSRIVLSNSANQALAIATVTAFSESGGTASVTTDLAALPAGADRISPHPCWDVTASSNTGALAVLNGSVNQPLFSHAYMTAAGSMTLWGGLTELRVNVTGTYAGNLTITGQAHGGTWTATVNLNTTGERVITTTGATGAQTGDTLPAAGWFQGAFTATAGGGTFAITATMDQTAVAPAAPAFASEATISPTSGAIGDTYTVAYTATGEPAPTISRAWTLDGTAVGANSDAVAPGAEGALRCVVTATNSQGSATSTTDFAIAGDPNSVDFGDASFTVLSVKDAPALTFMGGDALVTVSGDTGATRPVWYQISSADPAADPWTMAEGVTPFDATGLTNATEYRFDDGTEGSASALVTPEAVSGGAIATAVNASTSSALWAPTNDNSIMTANSDGTGGIPADGGPVGRVTSPNGSINLINSDAIGRPAFDLASGLLNGVTPDNTTYMTFSGTFGTNMYLAFVLNTSDDNKFLLADPATTVYAGFFNSGSTSTTVASGMGAITYKINGTVVSSPTRASLKAAIPVNTDCVVEMVGLNPSTVATLWLGRRGSALVIGQYGDVVFCDTPSGTQQDEIRAELAARHGITVV